MFWLLKSSLSLGVVQLARSPAVPPPLVHVMQARLPSLRCWHAQMQRGQGTSRGRAPLHSCTAAAVQHPGPAVHPSAPAVHHSQLGHIELVLGPMFAGKTSELLHRVEQYESQGLTVAIVKSNKDTRYSDSHVVTHDGVRKPCFAVATLAAFREAAGDEYAACHVIAVDEAQFFADVVEFCAAAADTDGKRVILAGLDGDFQRRRFGHVLDLVPMADSVTKLTATCLFCTKEAEEAAAQGTTGNGSSNGNGNGSDSHGRSASPALFSLRIAGDGSKQEEVGGADKYAPACRRHYVQLSQAGTSRAEG